MTGMHPSFWVSSESRPRPQGRPTTSPRSTTGWTLAWPRAAEWCYSPRWNDRDKDGWNGEDFSILDSSGSVRPSFRPRPYPRLTAGQPIAFRHDDGRTSGGRASFIFSWDHHSELGATEIFVPTSVFPAGAIIEFSGPGLSCYRDQARQLLVCQGPCRAVATVTIRTQ